MPVVNNVNCIQVENFEIVDNHTTTSNAVYDLATQSGKHALTKFIDTTVQEIN